MSRLPCAAALLSCLLALTLGCDNNLWWEYRDDPYLATMAKKGEPEVLRNLNSTNRDQRQMALRIVATQAGEQRRRGNHAAAKQLDDLILRRYAIEKDPVVRACVVRVCAPAVGRSETMVVFLRERIATGEFPGYAALSLAALAPRGAYSDIEPLTRHPAPEVRLQAAVALTVLADPQGFDSVTQVWRSMQPHLWPDRIDGVALAEAKASLDMRARRGFGRPLY